MLLLPLSAESKMPLYEQIYHAIKEKIRSGSLICGEQLPSSRALSDQLSVSRSTVNSAYEQLLSEGYLVSVEKRGYFVAGIGSMLPAMPAPKNNTPIVQPAPAVAAADSFSPFAIDMELFPHTLWKRFMNDAMHHLNSQTLSLGDPNGELSFRSAIADYLSQSRGVSCTPDQILIGAGTDYLLLLLCGLLTRNTEIAMENPTYLRAYHIFHGQGFPVLPIPVTAHGMDLAALEASDAQLAYITPSHQYPLGVVMPASSRSRLLSWAARAEHRYIIEDDHDSEFRYKGLPIPSLQGMDEHGRVIYLGTFSRTIAPAIRISYMVLPPELMQRFRSEFSYFSSTVSRVDQEILARFLREGHFERHLNKMRKLYHQRHDAMLHALRCFGDTITVSGENAGLHLVVTFHGYGTEEEIQQKAQSVGLHLYSLKRHELLSFAPSEPSFLFGFAGLTEEKTKQQVALLFHALHA